MKTKQPFKTPFVLTIVMLGLTVALTLYWGWPIWRQHQLQIQQRQEIHNQVETLLKQHHPDGLWLLQALDKLPLKVRLDAKRSITRKKIDPVARYMPSPDLKEILLRFGTLIHESSHAYHFRAGLVEAVNQQRNVKETDSFLKLWLSPQETFFVDAGARFPAREIVKQIPKSAQTDRFKVYIDNPDVDLATQADGLSGLLDEWLAYYQGIRAEMALLNHAYSQRDQIPEAERQIWLDYASTMSDQYLAYYEFKLYILAYLAKAQSDYPGFYQSLLQDPELKRVLASANRAYLDLIPRYLAVRHHFVAGSSLDAKRYLKDLQVKEQRLKAEINKPAYQQLEKRFML